MSGSNPVTSFFEWLLKIIHDNWGKVVSVSGVLGLLKWWQSSNKEKTDRAERLAAEFYTDRVKAILHLLKGGFLQFIESDDTRPYFSFASISLDPSEGWVNRALGDTVVLSPPEIENEVLNPLQKVAELQIEKAIRMKDVETWFRHPIGFAMTNPAINKYIAMRRAESPNVYMRLEELAEKLSDQDLKNYRKRTADFDV